MNVRDHLPLQQGLRPVIEWNKTTIALCVRDHLPLQQGLRLSHDVTLYNLVYCKYETIFHYNKD